jgi:hypothetical protein
MMQVEIPAPVRRPRIAVCGGHGIDDTIVMLAERVGGAIAEANAILICGGLGGVMEAAARGAARAGGLTVGVLPGQLASDANPWIALPLPTGMGEARNALVVRFADAIIAIDGEWGTLSEVALACRMGIPVVLLAPTLTAGLGLETAAEPDLAVARALALAALR